MPAGCCPSWRVNHSPFERGGGARVSQGRCRRCGGWMNEARSGGRANHSPLGIGERGACLLEAEGSHGARRGPSSFRSTNRGARRDRAPGAPQTPWRAKRGGGQSSPCGPGGGATANAGMALAHADVRITPSLEGGRCARFPGAEGGREAPGRASAPSNRGRRGRIALLGPRGRSGGASGTRPWQRASSCRVAALRPPRLPSRHNVCYTSLIVR